MRARCAIAVIGALSLFPFSPARAYTVQSGFTGGCHEDIIIRLSGPLLDDPIVEEVVLPAGDTWRKLAQPLLALADRELSQRQLFVLFSSVVGMRAPDTRGHSVSDLSAARAIAADPRPEVQYLHALRGREDDDPDGSWNAVEGTRASIRGSLAAAFAALERPIEKQNTSAPYTLDFYGLFSVPVWEPAYMLGQAAHTLQDSFSHSIRSDAYGLRKVTHVLNYVDAISTHFMESRDGIAHSRYLDGCVGTDVEELFEAADRATAGLFEAFLRMQRGDLTALDEVLDEWLTLQEGCTLDNDFCDNERWLEAARRDPTGTYLPNWMLCGGRAELPGSMWAWIIGALLVLIYGARKLAR